MNVRGFFCFFFGHKGVKTKTGWKCPYCGEKVVRCEERSNGKVWFVGESEIEDYR